MQEKPTFPSFPMNNSNDILTNSINFKNNENIQYSHEAKYNLEPLQNCQINPKPIGIYNFNSNKSTTLSLEENINEIVSTFVEQNKENIIKYVTNEVQNKLNEKIQPLNSQITEIKNTYNSIYEQELKNFKDLNILNDCHNNILNIDNKINIMNENINKYNEEIKRFNISDNRLQFLSKLNKDLQEFINGINKENEGGMEIELDEENYKINSEHKKQENVNQELDTVFNETLSLIQNIYNEEKTTIDAEKMNISDVENNLGNAINCFQMKYNCTEPVLDEKIKDANDTICLNKTDEINKKNIFENIPDFFGMDI